MFLIIYLEARKAISSVNNKAIMSKFSYLILFNIPLKYILNKMRDIREPYKTLAQISYS